jgi:hypothetical protein
VDAPVHVHWLADPPARRHCGRRSQPPPSSPPTVTRAVSGRIDPTNQPRVSANPTSHLLVRVRPSLAAGRPCSAARNLSRGLNIRTRGLTIKGILNPRFKILNLVNYVVNGRKIEKCKLNCSRILVKNLTFLERKFSNFSVVFKWFWIDQFE